MTFSQTAGTQNYTFLCFDEYLALAGRNLEHIHYRNTPRKSKDILGGERWTWLAGFLSCLGFLGHG